jgi:hypothetical protein
MSKIQKIECFKCSDGQLEKTKTSAIARELCFRLNKQACHELPLITADVLVKHRELVLDVLDRQYNEIDEIPVRPENYE